MNKKYSIYGLLLVIVTSAMQCVASQGVKDQALNLAGVAAVMAAGTYVTAKIYGKYKKHTLPDPSKKVDEWARGVLASKEVKNSDTIPLKIGDEWAVISGSFIQVNVCAARDIEEILSGKTYIRHPEETFAIA